MFIGEVDEPGGAEYLYECVATLSIEVEPLVVKGDVVAVTVDPARSVTHFGCAREPPVAALAVETDGDSEQKWSIPSSSSTTNSFTINCH